MISLNRIAKRDPLFNHAYKSKPRIEYLEYLLAVVCNIHTLFSLVSSHIKKNLPANLFDRKIDIMEMLIDGALRKT